MTNRAGVHLLPGEQVEWQGHPFTGLIFRPIDLFLIPFSVLWGGFALFWNTGVWAEDAPLDFKLFGVPFLVAGLYITIGRFFFDIMLRKKLTYFVTNQRILIEKQRGRGVKSVDIGRLPALELDERSDGSGSIRFGTSGSWFTSNNFGVWQPTFDPTPQFIRIPNVRFVYELIQKQTAR